MDVRLEKLKANLESVVAGVPTEQLQRHAPGKWSAAEVLEHLFLTYTATVKGLEHAIAEGRPLATRASLKHRVATFVVVGLGHMPTGRKTPAVATPRGLSEDQVRNDIGAKLVEMDALLAASETRFGRRVKVLDHPILGPLTAPQWRTLHAVHGQHHYKQLLALLGS